MLVEESQLESAPAQVEHQVEVASSEIEVVEVVAEAPVVEAVETGEPVVTEPVVTDAIVTEAVVKPAKIKKPKVKVISESADDVTASGERQHDPELSSEADDILTGIAEDKPKKKKKKRVVAQTLEASEIARDAEQADDAESLEVRQAKRAAKKAAAATGPSFRDLELPEPIQLAIEQSGYTTPTEIQSEIIPYMLDGRDVLAQSQTGTGKTAAFALPILSRIDTQSKKVQVLVLAPTRELAIQVAKSMETYGANLPDFAVAAIYGGQDYQLQFRQFKRGVQVVVGTPGRVIDHVKRGTLDLSNIDCLVLDEADEMLNMGFLEDVQFVLEKVPHDRQIALFSATLPEAIRHIADDYLRDPARITINHTTKTAELIRQRAVFVSPREKIDTLVRILEVEKTDGVIVFTKTREATLNVAEQLVRSGIKAVALNGDMAQKVRERTIEQLKSGELDVLVATDVAARGLDVPRISHVFNFDLPHDSESYVHRIGRTGRAGRSGEAIIFLTANQRGKLRLIERATKQTIEVMETPTAQTINAFRIESFKQSITDVTSSKDLTMFKDMLVKYAEETGKPMEMIAAGLAELSLQGRPFLMKDQPRSQSSRENFDRPSRFDSFTGEGDRPERGQNKGRTLGPPERGLDRYKIQVGWRDGVKPGNIVGAIANEAGISGRAIGPIKIYDAFSTIDLPENMPRDIMETLQNTRVAGRQLKLALDEHHLREDRRSGNRSYGNDRGSSNDRGYGNDRGPRTNERRPRAADGVKPKRQRVPS